MPLFIQKPIYWNNKSYRGPSGYPLVDNSWPKEHGYGHEEWNNDSRMLQKQRYGDLRFFHTEAVNAELAHESAGQTFVFMMVSYEGKQRFVGVAGCATYLGSDSLKDQRIDIAKRLKLDSFSKETWRLNHVRETYDGNHQLFLKNWEENLHWIPNWMCPESHYWWFEKPIDLPSQRIRDTKRWLSMFGSYTQLLDVQALEMMEVIPKEMRNEKWRVIYDAISNSIGSNISQSKFSDEEDVSDIVSKMTMAEARVGQGRYRAALLREWGDRCALTGIACSELLVASHIKPWSASNNKEKLDVENGLLLSANVNALFDRFLISFEDNGSLLASSRLSEDTIKLAGLKGFTRLRKKPSSATASYLRYHREKFAHRA